MAAVRPALFVLLGAVGFVLLSRAPILPTCCLPEAPHGSANSLSGRLWAPSADGCCVSSSRRACCSDSQAAYSASSSPTVCKRPSGHLAGQHSSDRRGHARPPRPRVRRRALDHHRLAVRPCARPPGIARQRRRRPERGWHPADGRVPVPQGQSSSEPARCRGGRVVDCPARGRCTPVRSFVRLIDVNPGYDPANVITAQVSLPPVRYGDPAAQQTFSTSYSSGRRQSLASRSWARPTILLPGNRSCRSASMADLNRRARRISHARACAS